MKTLVYLCDNRFCAWSDTSRHGSYTTGVEQILAWFWRIAFLQICDFISEKYRQELKRFKDGVASLCFLMARETCLDAGVFSNLGQLWMQVKKWQNRFLEFDCLRLRTLIKQRNNSNLQRRFPHGYLLGPIERHDLLWHYLCFHK